MPRSWSRREVMTTLLGAGVIPWASRGAAPALEFRVSLAQWSFHRALFSGSLHHLNFGRVARRDFGLDAIEYVNTFFKDKARDAAYLREMNRRADDEGVYQHLIMCDGEGRLGDPDAVRRRAAVGNHRQWLEAAKTLGCASIRVNAASEGSFDEQQRLAADGLRQLAEMAASMQLDVSVENHGGLSSNGGWLAGVMKLVDHPRCGTLPDFGNFSDYDRYQGVADMMPFAKAVSAKSHAFDRYGNETRSDYARMLRIVRESGYRGWIGIEYEGRQLSEREGVAATLRLLRRVI